MKETQIRAAELLIKCINKKILPEPVALKVPLMITGDKVITEEDPMKTILRELEIAEQRAGILSMSLFNGQNWVDAPNVGASIIAIAEKDRNIALAQAKKIGKLFWDAREKFKFQAEALEPVEAAEAAIRAEEGLGVLTSLLLKKGAHSFREKYLSL